jgi:RHS repeat-associated protein
MAESDRNGYQTSFAYNAAGQLTTVTDPAQRTFTFAYYPDGQHIKSVTDSAGRSVAFVYDASNNLQQVTDVGSGLTTFGYDANHLLLTITDPNRGVVTNTYATDGSGRVTIQVDPMQLKTQFSYNGNQTTITDPNNNVTVETYQNGELASRTDGYGTPQSATWSYQYDPVTNGIMQTTDPNQNVWTNKWDANGNLLQKTDPLQRSTIYTYNAFNEVLTAQDPLLVTTTNGYDNRGNLTSTSRPLTGTSQTCTVTYGYGDSAHPGDVTTMTDANGKLWQYAYDQYGDRIKVVDPMGNITTYTFDTLARMLTKVSPNGNVTGSNPAAYTTTNTYDVFGDLKTTTDPLSHQAVYSYDGNLNLTSVLDANQHQTINTYDLDNRLTQVQRADNSILKTTFDGNGDVLSQIDGLNNATIYTYDPLNRKATMRDANLRTTTYAYDAAGNLHSVLDPMARTTTYGYDTANQLKTIAYSDGKTPNVSFVYDNDGQRQNMSDGTGQTSYTFDSLHRLTQSTNGAGQQVKYGYDLVGHLASLTYPGGTNVAARTYDADGRLLTVADWLGHTTTFGYDANSNLTTEAYPNTTKATFAYSAADQLMSITDTTGRKNTTFMSLNYGRDPIGQMTSETPQTYSYDAVNRVKTNVNGSTTTTYGYDNGDNLLSIALSGSTTSTLSYDVAHQLQTYTKMTGSTLVQKLTYNYDSDGNRTSTTDQNSVVTTYGWDQANRLITYGTTASYSYDGDGLRMKKTLSGSAESFVWDTGEGLPLILQDGATSYITGPAGLPLEQITGTTVYYYHQDQLGNTRTLTDSGGASTATYTYDAYGNVTATGSIGNPFQFAGQYRDSESNLAYFRARYYDPAAGSFISPDPMAMVTRQAYVYVSDSPTNATDPSGLCDWWDVVCRGNEAKQWISNHAPALKAIAAVADYQATAWARVAGVCTALAIATSETVVGGAVFASCAAVATGGALGAKLINIGINAAVALSGDEPARDAVIVGGVELATQHYTDRIWSLCPGQMKHGIKGALAKLGLDFIGKGLDQGFAEGAKKE